MWTLILSVSFVVWHAEEVLVNAFQWNALLMLCQLQAFCFVLLDCEAKEVG